MVSQVKDGLDFFFTDQSTASKLIEWMKAKVPLRARHTSKLVSQDFNSNVNHMKHTTVLEVGSCAFSCFFFVFDLQFF
jgi:nonsense-mediated mRNA decay protein 3